MTKLVNLDGAMVTVEVARESYLARAREVELFTEAALGDSEAVEALRAGGYTAVLAAEAAPEHARSVFADAARSAARAGDEIARMLEQVRS